MNYSTPENEQLHIFPEVPSDPQSDKCLCLMTFLREEGQNWAEQMAYISDVHLLSLLVVQPDTSCRCGPRQHVY